MSNSYILDWERLRAQLRGILRTKGKTVADEAPMATLVPLVNSVGINHILKSIISGAQFELIDTEGEITTVSTSILKSTAITKIKLPKLTGNVYTEAFRACTLLTEAEISTEATSPAILGSNAFYGCTALTEFKGGDINFYGTYCLYGCTSLIKATFDSVVLQDYRQFYGCTALKIVDFGETSAIANYDLFDASANLEAIVIRNSTLCTLAGTKPFNWLKNNVSGWKIYVPDALVDSYKVASQWSTFADYFAPLSDYNEEAILNGGGN